MFGWIRKPIRKLVPRMLPVETPESQTPTSETEGVEFFPVKTLHPEWDDLILKMGLLVFPGSGVRGLKEFLDVFCNFPGGHFMEQLALPLLLKDMKEAGVEFPMPANEFMDYMKQRCGLNDGICWTAHLKRA